MKTESLCFSTAAESQPRVASQKKVTVKVTPMKAQTAVVQTPVSNKSTTMESKRTASNGKVISTPATISAKQSRKVLLSSSDEE